MSQWSAGPICTGIIKVLLWGPGVSVLGVCHVGVKSLVNMLWVIFQYRSVWFYVLNVGGVWWRSGFCHFGHCGAFLSVLATGQFCSSQFNSS